MPIRTKVPTKQEVVSENTQATPAVAKREHIHTRFRKNIQRIRDEYLKDHTSNKAQSLGKSIRAKLFLKNSINEIPSMILEGHKLSKDQIINGVGIPKFQYKPVVLIPGLIGIKPGINTIDAWLERIWCKPFKVELGIKQLTPDSILDTIDKTVDAAYKATGKKPVLIRGYSVGALEAVVYANRHPDKVESIITLGGAKKAPIEVNFLLDVLLQGIAVNTGRDNMARFIHEAASPSRVPSTSIYSKQDGIVNWENCIDPKGNNIEVRGSHLSFFRNADVYRNIVKVLSGKTSN